MKCPIEPNDRRKAEERNDIMKNNWKRSVPLPSRHFRIVQIPSCWRHCVCSIWAKKVKLTGILKQMGKLSAEERPAMGQLANQVRADIENALAEKQKKLADAMLAHKLESETLDITLPGKKQKVGSMHPLTIVENEIREIFLGMGFSVADGPEVEYDYYNFEALNLPPDHPARDTQDTFYITDNILLRTQTSSVQVHVMENQKPPIRVISSGRVYRSDAVDATHSPLFHQIEGLVVDKGHHHGRSEGYSGTADASVCTADDCKIRSCVPTTSRSQNPAQRSTLCASSATERAAGCARAKAISNCWVQAWSTRRCWRAAALTVAYIPALPLVWVWSVSQCAAIISAICVCSMRTTIDSWNSSEWEVRDDEFIYEMAG